MDSERHFMLPGRAAVAKVLHLAGVRMDWDIVLCRFARYFVTRDGGLLCCDSLHDS